MPPTEAPVFTDLPGDSDEEILYSFGEQAAKVGCHHQAVQFDPTIILIIIQVAVAIYQACKKPPTYLQAIKPGWLDTWALNHAARKVCGRQVWKTHGPAIVRGMKDRVVQMTEPQYKKLAEAVVREASMDWPG
jgi:hypothetical protein